MKTATTAKPPQNLSKEAKKWWVKIVSTWRFDDAGLLILQGGLECFDRQRQAQAILARDGITFVDRFGQIRQHPATLIERDAKAGVLRALKALNLDIEGVV